MIDSMNSPFIIGAREMIDDEPHRLAGRVVQRITGVALEPERSRSESTGKLLLHARRIDAERAVDDGLARRAGEHVIEVLANLSVEEKRVRLHAARRIVRARHRR